jgi:glycerol-3-phosphate acyltransferase PlsX
MLKIALDAMGGDFGPEPIIEGLVAALKKNNNFTAIAVGKKEEIEPLIPRHFLSRVEILDTDDVISMTDSATDALKRKDSTIYKAIELVKNEEADAVVSAGHSGASMSLATLRIGRIKGVSRPAIATLMPTSENQNTLVLDVGANVDSDANNLFQFAIMGQVYSQDVLQLDEPIVGLLSNGEEESKGNEVTKQAYGLISKIPNFAGNVEGSIKHTLIIA